MVLNDDLVVLLDIRQVHLLIVESQRTVWRTSVSEAEVCVPFISEKKVMLVIDGINFKKQGPCPYH